MSFPNIVFGSEGELWHNSATETVPVGTLMIIEDGRSFRFCEIAASVTTVVGGLLQAEVHTTDQSGEAVGTLDAGVTRLTGVGSTSSGLTLNEYVNGYAYTDNAVTLPMMRIRANSAITAGDSDGTIDLYIKTPTAIASGNTLCYIKNPWRDVILKPASAETAPAIGINKVVITADQFGWVQTSGPASALYDASTTAIATIGDPIAPDQAVASAISGIADSTTDTVIIIGNALGVVEGDTNQTPVFLRME
ncbi:hypothetical protein LCGC14_2090370 [marine sediment metagenome]|uniref:Uncharacterized protein n=1 Tax=marine sediment metagenome TaxID=412755 RepID=A0A0F9ED74_9ZZZZ